ncbi:MAG TPA: hypothetical protein VG496_09780 [Myxococcales bacterium]|nr:hypothetical protein [Myxococcales bacterium]
MKLWVNLYLGAFLVGVICIAGMLLAGGVHHAAGHGHSGHGAIHGKAHAHAHTGAAHGLWSWIAPFLNVASLVALVMCGGAAGYMALQVGLRGPISLIPATAGGFAGAWVMATTIRLLSRAEAGRLLTGDPRGTVARVIAPIAVDRMGEIVFCRDDGGRQAMAARLDHDGQQIERDAQVVVTRVERGTAYVQRLETHPGKESATWNP